MSDSVIPIVSIQCLAYNHEKYIRDCLDGIVSQITNFRYEAIVHDDASTDDTQSIIREYAAKYPDIIKSVIEKENLYSKNLGRLRRVLQENLRGKYIAFCECDDYWIDRHKLQKQVDFLESHPDYSMCFHSAQIKYEVDSTSWLDCENIEDRDYSATEVFIHWTVPTASILCRRDAFVLFHNLKGGERILNGDIALILSCMTKGKVRGFSEKMSVYRVQNGGVTYDEKAKKNRSLKAPFHFECLRDNFPIVDHKPLDETIAKTYFERALVQDDYGEMIKDFRRSFNNSPKRFFSMTAHTIWKRIRGLN